MDGICKDPVIKQPKTKVDDDVQLQPQASAPASPWKGPKLVKNNWNENEIHPRSLT